MKYQGLIFDFNGVLFWDTPLHEEAWRQISHKIRGNPFSLFEIDKHVHGRPNRYIFEYLLAQPLSDSQVLSFAFQKESLYQKLCLENLNDFKLSPGAEELLAYLTENEIPFTIATASDKFNLDFFVKHLHLERWFDVAKIVYENGTFHGKPAPDPYLIAAKNLNLVPRSCVVVEDSKIGLTSAIAASVGKVIALGPKEHHQTLKSIQGVHDTIVSLAEMKKELFQ